MHPFDTLTTPEALDELEAVAQAHEPDELIAVSALTIRALVDGLRTARQGDRYGAANLDAVRKDLGVTSPKMDDVFARIAELTA